MATEKRRRRHSPPAATPGASSSSNPEDAVLHSPSPPADVILDIASRLTSLEDFFALRASCRAYRALLPTFGEVLTSQSPLLLVQLLPYFSEALFHPTLRRLHRFRLPWSNHLPIVRRTILYAHGYLVTATVNHHPARLLLIHLFSGEQIRLPKAPVSFSRVILSDDLTAVVFTPGGSTVQHCHLGDTLWRVAPLDARDMLIDMLFVDDTLYALVGLRLAIVELSESSLELSFLWEEVDDENRPAGHGFKLGECGGEVLLISESSTEMLVYHVFRWVSEEGKWASVTSLGGRTLFLGYDGFASCLGPDCPGIRGDCLYVSGVRLGEWHEYSLADGTCNVRYADYPGAPPLNNYSHLRPPVWVFPSLC
ncbi:hypothetical protein HU200_010517 [Digitaria exilis]|uniref:KIB1-4 beta-propeller domain-containing protein n=1 Tax=Digitaria exilis TaxID=1010633 RepID=A0A835FIH7_9POAL|nr:hypothetical protein HU200_010517 [Digitaria exilis]